MAKLVRRHPHVFGSVSVSGADEVSDNWDAIKAAERAAKGGDASVLAGVPMGQPALSLAAQLLGRATRAGAPPELAEDVGSGLGARLFALVREAQQAGLDPEAELRAAARAYRDRVREWEASRAERRRSRSRCVPGRVRRWLRAAPGPPCGACARRPGRRATFDLADACACVADVAVRAGRIGS